VNERLVKIIPYLMHRETALKEIKTLLCGVGDTPDAVFFLTNYLGVLGIEAIKDLDIKVPEQLAVLCFDDNDIFRLYNPTISVIRQPIEAIGQKAMVALIERLKHAGPGVFPEDKPVKLEAELIARQSI